MQSRHGNKEDIPKGSIGRVLGRGIWWVRGQLLETWSDCGGGGGCSSEDLPGIVGPRVVGSRILKKETRSLPRLFS